MKLIIATNKSIEPQTILIDDEDYDKLSKQKWYIRLNRHGKIANIIANIKINGCDRVITMGQFIMEAYDDKTVRIIYLDNNKLNNTRSNLMVKHLEGVIEYDDKNYGLKQRPGASRYRGVVMNKNRTRFMPSIKYKGKNIYLGTFPNTAAGEMDAAIARDIKVLELFGDRAILNFPIAVLRTHFAKRINEKFITGDDSIGWSIDIPITSRTTKHIGDYGTLAEAIKARNEFLIEWGGEDALDKMLNG